MRDDNDNLSFIAISPTVSADPRMLGGNVIPFTSRAAKIRSGATSQGVAPEAVIQVLEAAGQGLTPACAAHAPTRLAALGALAGFAAQQSLLARGGADWAQPMRNGQLDRLLLASGPTDSSLWFTLCQAARQLGCNHLPDPQKLLEATLRCVGTTQFGLITLPLEYKLHGQPLGCLSAIWLPVRDVLVAEQAPAARWPQIAAGAAARQVALDQRQVPVHVALRIVMQAALAMALIEPRLVRGAALKSGT